jgi:predicted nucleotidyltransferase
VSAPAFDELLRKLADANIKFVLVGGLAMNAWGVVRGTNDVDLVVARDQANLDRLAEVAVAMSGGVQTEHALLGTPFSIAERLSSGERVQIETELGTLDVVQGLPGVPPYEQLRKRATKTEILGVTICVCSLEDLRAMKRAAGRTRDLADLEDLDTAYGPEGA